MSVFGAKTTPIPGISQETEEEHQARVDADQDQNILMMQGWRERDALSRRVLEERQAKQLAAFDAAEARRSAIAKNAPKVKPEPTVRAVVRKHNNWGGFAKAGTVVEVTQAELINCHTTLMSMEEHAQMQAQAGNAADQAQAAKARNTAEFERIRAQVTADFQAMKAAAKKFARETFGINPDDDKEKI